MRHTLRRAPGARPALVTALAAACLALALPNAPRAQDAEASARLDADLQKVRADVEKARRHLTRLVDSGLATRADGVAGGAGGGQQTRYYASARHLTAVG